MHDFVFVFSKLFATSRCGDKDVIFGLQNKKNYHAGVSLLCYFLGSWSWGTQFNFQRNLKLITPDNYCKTRSAAQKYNPQVNVNVESTCVDGGSFRNLNFSREQILWLKKPI